MTWDAARGRSTRPPEVWETRTSIVTNTWIIAYAVKPLKTWYQAYDAAEFAAWTAYAICAANLAGAWLLYREPPEAFVLFGRTPEALAVANLTAAVLAGWLGLVVRRRRPVWVAWVVMAWAVIEVIPWASRFIYGQYVPLFVSILMVWGAVLGVRGAYSLRRMNSDDPANLGLERP